MEKFSLSRFFSPGAFAVGCSPNRCFTAFVAVASFFFIVDLALVLEVAISEANWGQRREMEDERERIERAERSSLSLSSPDIISTLPDSVLSHILSFLPIRDYVATSILSRNWNRVSTLVPSHIASHHLPTALVMTFNQGSTVNTMDFHPLQHFLLLGKTSSSF